MPGLEDLPRYSPWPARLLGLQSWSPTPKTAAEVTREYDRDKWGEVWRRIRDRQGGVRLADVESWQGDPARECLIWEGGRWDVMSASAARIRYFDWLASVLKPYLPASAVVELGAGYGSVLLGLARRGFFGSSRLLAGEYTASGLESLRALARAEGLKVESGRCDLAQRPICDWGVDHDALVYTSYAACYLPHMTEQFVRGLLDLRPARVVHVEPLYEHCQGCDLLSLLRRRYIEANDYNRNLLDVLRDAASRGMIDLEHVGEPGFGANPLLAASVVVWRPCKR